MPGHHGLVIVASVIAVIVVHGKGPGRRGGGGMGACHVDY